MACDLECCNCVLCSPDSDNASLNSESTYLSCPTQEDSKLLSITPLPKLQLFIVTCIQIAEPVTSTVIYPFVNDLVRKFGITHGDEKKTGYYVGLIESAFFAAEALTVLQWGRASDTIGRRPILLGGTLGLSISMLSFGWSKKYAMLLLSRCAQGAFNGNIGVTKSVVAEITDATNAPQAFTFLPLGWSVGSTLGPLIGGALTEPAERWPDMFGSSQFFQDYPFFLPCMVATLVPLFAFLLAFLGLKETLPSAVERQKQINSLKSTVLEADEAGFPDQSRGLLSASCDLSKNYGAITHTESCNDTPVQYHPPTSNTAPPFSAILIPRVLVPITNLAFLAFLDQCLFVLIPLFYSTPFSLGGLGLHPSTIGTILGAWGVINALVQFFCFAWIRKHLGQRACYSSGIAALGICFMLFPVLSRLAAWDGESVGCWVWLGITLQLTVYMFAYMSYACIFMYIAASAPSRSALGTTNGLAQLTGSSVRALAPSVASSLFSFSLQLSSGETDVSGDLVYLVLVAMSLAGLWWSFRLPRALNGEQNHPSLH